MKNNYDLGAAFDAMENIPEDLLKDITEIPEPAPVNDIKQMESITAHTKPPVNVLEAAAGVTQQAQTTALNSPVLTSSQIRAGNLITGETAVKLMDTVLPVLLVMLMQNVFNKKTQKGYFKLSRDEKEMIAEPMQHFLNSINLNMDTPLNALLVTIVFVYGTKTIEVLNNTPAEPAKTPSPFPQENKEETRGRHKKDCNCDKCKNKKR